MNARRKRELDRRYQVAVRGASQEEATHLYTRYLKTFHVELDERGRSAFLFFLLFANDRAIMGIELLMICLIVASTEDYTPSG